MIWGCAVRNRIEKKINNKHEKSHLLSFVLAHRTFFLKIRILKLPNNTLQTPYLSHGSIMTPTNKLFS